MKLLNCLVVVALAFTFSPILRAEEPPGLLKESALWTQKGNLFTIKLIPGSKQIQVHVVGKKQAEFDLAQTNVTAVFETPEGAKTLNVNRSKGYFLIDKPEDPGTLKLKTETRGKAEDFEFPLK